MRGGTHKIQVRLLSILMLEKAASLDVLFQRSCWQIIFPPLLSVLAAEEERDQIRRNSGHTVSFLALPTKQRPAWPFGYCKISNSVFYLAHFISQHSLRAGIGVRACLTHWHFLSLCCRLWCCLTKLQTEGKSTSVYPSNRDSLKPVLTPRRVNISEVFFSDFLFQSPSMSSILFVSARVFLSSEILLLVT